MLTDTRYTHLDDGLSRLPPRSPRPPRDRRPVRAQGIRASILATPYRPMETSAAYRALQPLTPLTGAAFRRHPEWMTPQRRKLTTILALDVVGYSRAAERDEAAAAAMIDELGAVIADIASALGGRIFNTAGDGFMLEFPSAGAGVHAAMLLLEEGQARGQQLPAIRIGLHLGDVIAQANGDLLGHGVNIAARLQALAQPGAAMVSETVRAQVRSNADLPFTPHGRVQLDKMSERLSVFSLNPTRARGINRIEHRRIVRVACIAAAAFTLGFALMTGAMLT